MIAFLFIVIGIWLLPRPVDPLENEPNFELERLTDQLTTLKTQIAGLTNTIAELDGKLQTQAGSLETQHTVVTAYGDRLHEIDGKIDAIMTERLAAMDGKLDGQAKLIELLKQLIGSVAKDHFREQPSDPAR